MLKERQEKKKNGKAANKDCTEMTGQGSNSDRRAMGYRSSPVPSTFKLCITNLGGAASSFATNGNPED